MQEIKLLTHKAAELPLPEREQLMLAIQESIQDDYEALAKRTLDEHLELCRQRLHEHKSNPSQTLSVDESFASIRAIQ